MNISFNGKKSEPKIRNRGFNRAQCVASAVSLPASAAGLGIVAGMRQVSKLSKGESIELSKAVQEGLKTSGLYDKGVRVFKMQELPMPSLKSKDAWKSLAESILKTDKKDKKAMTALTDEIKSSKLFKKLLNSKIIQESGVDPNDVMKTSILAQKLQFKAGINACYLPNVNKIITPSKSLQTSVFHEMGHALNANGGAVLKALQKMRPVAMILPGIILAVSLLNKQKVNDETDPNASAVKKGANFVKRHAGLLTGLSFAPMVLEEGLASLRGQGIAKKLVQNGTLSKDILKKVKLTNLGGFASYALAAVGAILATKAAIAVKDKIQAKYEAKKILKAQQK